MNREDELPTGWAWATVNQVAQSIHYGYTASAIHQTAGPRFLRITDIQHGQVNWDAVPTCDISKDDLEKYHLSDGDIVFARTGATTGKSHLIRNCPDAVFASYLIRLQMKPALHPAFLQTFFQTLDYWRQVESGKRGIGQPNVNAKTLGMIVFPVAPFNEQRRIVAKIEELFSDLDAGVAAIERAKANLKRYRAAVLKAAVEGRLTEQWRAENPAQEPASKLLERILKQRRKKWEQDQLAAYEAKGKQPPTNWRDKYQEPAGPGDNLPALPEGWCWATVSQVSQFVRYGSSAKASLDSSGVPILRMGNIQDGELDVTDLKLKYLPRDHAEFPELLLEPGDFLFNRTNSAELVGKSAVYRGAPAPCSYASYLIAVRLCSGCDSHFLACYVNSSFGRVWIKTVVSQQVGQANVNGAKLQALCFPLPPTSEQRNIVQQVEERLSVLEQVDGQIEANLRRATRLRQSILKRAFEGNLVPQDPTDEPALVLLGRIAAEIQTTAPRNSPKPRNKMRRRG